ncbi:LysR family transcriptional regulator substrate-binding protein [Cupriavidus pinatubonensis]|nr:LysR family transcriptional regulator substrate-binding protein [Cupriavidus pinatubonensis]
MAVMSNKKHLDRFSPRSVLDALWKHTAVLIPSHSHPWAERDEVTLAELRDQPMVRRESGSMTQKAIDEALRRAGVRPRFTHELGSREALCEAVSAGLGCGIVWDSEAQASERFRTIRLQSEPIHSTDYLSCLKSELSRQVIQALYRVAGALPRQLDAGSRERRIETSAVNTMQPLSPPSAR